MNYLDLIFIIIILFFTFSGLRKGLVKVVGGILGIFVGIYFAGLFYLQFSEWLQTFTELLGSKSLNIISFILVFIIANRIFAILIFLLDKIVQVPIINSINKLLGAILGFIQGALIIALIVTIFSNLGPFVGADTILSKSQIAPYSDKLMVILKPFLPQDLKSIPQSFFNKAKSISDSNDLKNMKVNLENMNIDELIDYLNTDHKIENDLLKKIKENALKQEKKNMVEYITKQFQEYLNKID